MKTLKYIALVAAALVLTASCDDFLDRPSEDNYNTGNFYQNDEQCLQGVNYIYNSPWYDFQRGFIKVGEVFSGNLCYGSTDPYQYFTVNSTDENLVNMSYSLWAVIGHCSTVIDNIKNSSGPSQAIKDQCVGECLVWKAMAYFYLVRSFGEVPIIHNNSDVLGSGSYGNVKRVQKADIYEYIVMTLEKAMELLPKKEDQTRLTYWSAEALLAKVLLTRSGLAGTRNADDLKRCAELCKDVMDNSGLKLMENYEDLFLLQNNVNSECLISWRWVVGAHWTCQNTFQSDLGMVGFDEYGDTWGQWVGVSVDLQEAFGVSALDDPAQRNDIDKRRHATMMLPGDKYPQFWQDKGGFDYTRFIYDSEGYGKGGPGENGHTTTGANCAKHLYGNNGDHEKGIGHSAARMASSLATHLLRLADVYLMYTEAMMGTNSSTSDASAIDAFYAVRHRAVPAYTRPSQVTFDDVWKERRLEFALEGDRWYDYVRRSYWDMAGAMADLKSQKRAAFGGDIDAVHKNYYESGTWSADGYELVYLSDDDKLLESAVTEKIFTLPLAQEDVIFNPALLEDPIHVDVRSEYSY